jgi:hypothetical protein
VYFSLQLLFTSIFSRTCIIYYYIHALRDEVRGLQTRQPLTGRFPVSSGREGGDSLAFGAGKRWARIESRGMYIFLFNFIGINYLFCIYYLYISSNLFVILINKFIFLFYIYKIFFSKFILFFDLFIFLNLIKKNLIKYFYLYIIYFNYFI